MIEINVQSLVERIPALVYVYAVNHDTGESSFPYLSEYIQELLGFSAEEGMKDPKPLVNAIHEDEAEAYAAAVLESMTHLTPFDQRGRMRRTDGEIIHVHFKSKPRRVDQANEDGTVSHLTVWDGIVFDCTKQVLNEESNHTKMQAIMKNNLQPIFEVDSRGNVIEWNESISKLTERTREEVMGVPVVGFMAEEERGHFAAFFPHALKPHVRCGQYGTGIPRATEQAAGEAQQEKHPSEQQWDFVFISKTQRKRVYLHAKCTASQDINGGDRGLLCCCQDLTMVKEAEKQKDAALKLVDAERGLTEWLSHEVRNPLSVAMEAAVALQDEEKQSNGTDSYSDLICESIRYIVDLLTNMLDLNKCLDGKIAMHPTKCRIRQEVLAPTCKIMHVNNPRVRLELVDGSEVVAFVDKLRLRQVITNLVANSLKFTSDGFVRVELKEITGPQHNSFLRISVSDSGCGIDPGGHDVLFSKWERLGSQVNGAGIGLCLSKSLVKAMGGDLTANKEYQSGYKDKPGAQFIVEVPLSNMLAANGEPARMPAYESVSAAVMKRKNSLLEDEEPHASCSSSPAERKKKCRSASTRNEVVVRGRFHILIVDDDAMGRRLLRRRFSRLFPDAKITEVESGEAALREAEKVTYDLITVDHFMAVDDMTGEETIRALRERHDDSCIVGISGNAKREEHLSAGAQDFFQKPIPKDDVLMDRLISKISPPSEWKVLCVDDVALNIRFLYRKLRKISAPYFTSMKEAEKRWDITSRSTGEEAMELLKKEPFDLIILDQHLGDGMAGTAVARFAREHGVNKDAVIVLNSGSIMKESADPELAPYNLYWPKPLPTTEKMRLDLCRELLHTKNGHRDE